MEEARPLRDVFDRLVAQEHGAAGGLGGSGHDDLDATLLADALVGYCDTVPIEVAEHLEHFVTAVTTHQTPDPALGLDLLTTAPTVTDGSVVDPAPSATETATGPEADGEPAADLGFGTGTTEIALPDTGPEPVIGDSGTVEDDVLPGDDDPADGPADPGTEGWLDLTSLDHPDDPEAGPTDDQLPGE